jgi:hypothetical protein
MRDEQLEPFWDSLPTKVRNCLRRAKCSDPWNWTIKGLIRIPGIGPDSLVAIARSIQKHCV